MALNLNTTGPIRGRLTLEDITADRTLVAEDTGKIFLMDTIGEAIIIPAAAAAMKGVNYTFVCGVKVDNTSNWTITSAGSSDIHLQIGSGGTAEADTITAGGGDDAITFVKNLSDEGDYVKMVCTGTKWLVEGQCHATANITTA